MLTVSFQDLFGHKLQKIKTTKLHRMEGKGKKIINLKLLGQMPANTSRGQSEPQAPALQLTLKEPQQRQAIRWSTGLLCSHPAAATTSLAACYFHSLSTQPQLRSSCSLSKASYVKAPSTLQGFQDHLIFSLEGVHALISSIWTC